ncbi:MAG: IS4 family transposase [Chloroflexia bacterium]
MATIPQVASAMQRILGPVAERAARATGLVQRTSKLTGARFVQTLVFGWLAQPTARLSQLAQTAATLGVAISAQGLDDRFGVASAECLREVLEEAVQVVLAADAAAVPVLQRFTAVAVQDCTTISLPAALADVWPGCGGGTPPGGAAALKLSVRLDLARGCLQGPYLEAGRTNDRATTVADLPLPPGGLRLADLGFFSVADLAAQDQQGVSWLSRWQAGTTVATAAGEPQELLALLTAGEASTVDRPVLLGAQQRLPVRLLAARVPQEVADERRRRLRAAARDKGRAVSATRLRLCEWTVFLTNVPLAQLTLREALVLARARWQIELLFKLWKSHLRVDEWRSANPWRILTEVYAKLLAALVQHWLVLVGCWHQPDRSLVKAAQAIQAHAPHLAAVFDTHPGLCQALHIVARCLAAAGRLNKRQPAPSTTQLLLALDAEALA